MTDDIRQLLERVKCREEEKKGDDDEVSAHLKAYYYTFDFNSPYAEVRATVSNTDDPSLPVETFRAWFLGLGIGSIFSALNQVNYTMLRV